MIQGASLYVPGAETLVPRINKLLGSDAFTARIATFDWHPSEHVSFVTSHEGRSVFDKVTITDAATGAKVEQTLWPVHAVQNTKGAELHGDLEHERVTHKVFKGRDVNTESYSAFLNCYGRTETEIEDILRETGATSVVFCGVAAEVCVLNSAIDAAKILSIPVYVVADGMAAVGQDDGHAEALDRMTAAGVHAVSTAEALAL